MAEGALTEVASYEDEAEARLAARRLIEAGVGAEVAEGVEPGDDEHPAGRVWLVQVLHEDVPRACAALGVAPPEDLPEEEPTGTPWKMILGIWLAAMIIIPLLAFWFTYKMGS